MSRIRNMSKSTLYAIIALAVTVFGVALAQTWPNYPILGGPSYCSSTVNNSCVNTVPAGPAITGSETIPADTNLSQGRSPQTVKLTMQDIGVGTTQWVVPLTAANLTVFSEERQMIAIPAGTIAAMTVTLPPAASVGGHPALVEGQRWGICSSQTITALTLTAGAGTTIVGTPTAITVSTTGSECYQFIYRLSNTTWYRTQ